MFRTLALDVGKPSSSPELNHVSRWLTRASPVSSANAPASRLLPHPGKGRYLQSFSLYPQQKQSTLLSSCTSIEVKCFFPSSCTVCSDSGQAPCLCRAHRAPYICFPSRQESVSAAAYMLRCQKHAQSRAKAETLPCWGNTD